MLLLGLLASMALSAEPVAVVLARRTGVSAPDAAAVVATAASTLGLPGMEDPTETARHLARLGLKDGTFCKGREGCLAELGQQLEVRWLVLLSVSQLGVERSLGLELLQVSAEKVVEREALLLTTEAWLSQGAVVPFLERVLARLEAAARVSEAIRAGAPAPGLDASVAVGAGRPAAPNRGPSLVLAGAGALVLGVAVALLVLGLQSQAQLSQGEARRGSVYSPLTAAQAQATAARATGELGGSGAAAAVGLGLGVAAVLAW
jgi:hypothetical protein